MERVTRKDGSYRYREKIYIGGKTINSSFFKRKSDAVVWKRLKLNMRDKLNSLGEQYVPDISVNDYSKTFILNKSTLAPRTLDSYSNALTQHILPLLGNLKLREVRLQNGEELKLRLVNLGLGATRINNIIKVFKILLNDAVKSEHLHKSPLANLKPIPSQKRTLEYWLPKDVHDFLVANQGCSHYPLFLVALNTGMRKGELCGLCWDAVDFTNKQITVKRTYDRYGLKESTKSNKERTIPMNEPVLNTLLALKEQRNSLQFVFTRKGGSPIDYKHLTHRYFNKAIEKAGVKKIRFHDLRTTFASNFCMNGGDIFALSKILGHSSVTITQERYAHLHSSFINSQIEFVNFSASSSPHLALVNSHETDSSLKAMG